MNPHVILASGSPRRAQLLAQLGVDFTAVAADIDETPRADETAETLVERLARAKAEALAAVHPQALIIGSDTVVARAGAIFGKPADAAEAAAMLEALAGTTHRVASAVAVRADGRVRAAVQVSRVTMRAIGADEIAAYWRSGEPRDKAGGYAIQGRGAVFIECLEGSYSAVMGLPLFETAALLRGAGLDPLYLP